MSDIVRELREMADYLWDVEHRINVDDDAKTLKAAAEEIERLRAALQQIVDEAESDDGLTAWDGGDIAREALNIHNCGGRE